jgi:hypothetical protein
MERTCSMDETIERLSWHEKNALAVCERYPNPGAGMIALVVGLARRLARQLDETERISEALTAERDLHFMRLASVLWALPSDTLTAEVRKWEAEYRAEREGLNSRVATLAAELRGLADAEAEYRRVHDQYGGSDRRSGRAWDLMRRAGDRARAALQGSPAPEITAQPIITELVELHVHCWHGTDRMLLTMPPQWDEVCCYCGETRLMRGGVDNPGQHGPHLPGFPPATKGD